jgi:pyruvate formate lyase activating enzyme
MRTLGATPRGKLAIVIMAVLGLCTAAVPFLARQLRPGLASERATRGRAPRGLDVATLKEAAYYRKLDRNEVQCVLCPRECIVRNGELGDCGVKANLQGAFYSLVYGKPCAVSVEPIEKAPFNHYLPGTTRLCIATVGCNMHCEFCQNWQISQQGVGDVEYQDLTPEEVVRRALDAQVASVCFTFSEPIVFYEYMVDIARLARSRGLRTEMVSNGYINPEPLRALLETLDGVKIDLKGFSEAFYEGVTKGRLDPVLATIRTVAASGTWLEIVNLVVPTLNDAPTDIEALCAWIRREIGPDVPVHFTRFAPNYKLTNLPPTPVETLDAARSAALAAGLHFVYVGNVPGHPSESTFCPGCGALLIERQGYTVLRNLLVHGACPACGRPIPGVWQ